MQNKSVHMNQVPHQTCTYLCFLWHEVTMSIFTPPEWMLVLNSS